MRIVDDWELDAWDEVDQVPAVETLPGQNRIAKWAVWTSFGVAVVLVLVVGWVGWWYLQRVQPDTGAPDETVQFTIAEGDTLDDVADALYAQGLVEDRDVFVWYVGQHDGLEVAPGYYELRTNSHVGDILARLRRSPAETKKSVTFPEGFTVTQIAERLAAQQPRLSTEGFLAAAAGAVVPEVFARPDGTDSIEGLLFPDTYQVSNADNEAQVVERMVGLMERVANQEDLVEGAEGLGRTPYEILIIASMIEKEAKLAEDRPKIAKVIYNRLFLGMPLQIDATLLYGQPRGSSQTALAQIDGPYNTYTRTGLPPTPIASPGRASIQAALHPAADPPSGDPICRALPDPTTCHLLYYVIATPEGGHAFGASLEQHEANVARARAAGLFS